MLEIKALSAETVPDFYRLHCSANNLDACSCVAWWCPTWEEFKVRTPEENRAQRDALFAAGEFDGYLLYLNGVPLGWGQVGPVSRLKKLCDQYGLSRETEEWAFSCFALAPKARGRGFARPFLQLVVDDLKARGVGAVLAFPVRGSTDPWTGLEKVFLDSGFVVEKEDSKRPILRRRF